MSHFNSGGVARISLDYIFPHKYEYAQIIEDLNYGFVEFNWGETKESSSLKIGIKDFNNDVRLKMKLDYIDLKYSDHAKEDILCEADFNETYTLFSYFVSNSKAYRRQVIGYLVYGFVIINTVILMALSSAKILRLGFSVVSRVFRLILG